MRSPLTAVQRRLSLVARVSIATGLVFAVGVGVASLALVLGLRSSLLAGVDDLAQQRVESVTEALATAPNDVIDPGDTSVQVLGPAGRVATSTADLVGVPPLVTPDQAGIVDEDHSPIGDRRLLVRHVQTPQGARTIVVATSAKLVDRAVTHLVTALGLGLPALTVVLVLLVRASVLQALKVVERMRRDVAVIGATDLHRRVHPPAAQDGLHDLAVTMNDLLHRLELAAAGQRRFVADAAHELRSPLAGLRTQLEVTSRSDDVNAWAAAAPRLLAGTERLSAMVDDLVMLARLDDADQPARTPVDLDELVAEEVQARPAGDPMIVLSLDAAVISGDPRLLRRMIGNLLDNARRHARSRVRVTLVDAGDVVRLSVADDGEGIPAAERGRVFDRFHRLDAARTRDEGGSGLGLAIVREAARAHDGDVVVRDAEPGALFEVTLPTGR